MRTYSAAIKISGVTTARTVLHLTVPAGRHVEIVSAMVTGVSASSQQLECSLHKVASGSPTGTAVTPSRHDLGDTASACTVVGNLTGEPTYTSAPVVNHGHSAQPSLGGWLYPLVPRAKEHRLQLAATEAYGLRLLNAPSPSIDLIAELVFAEVG